MTSRDFFLFSQQKREKKSPVGYMGKMDFVENFSQHIDIRLIYKKMFSSSGSYKLFSYNLNLISKTE